MRHLFLSLLLLQISSGEETCSPFYVRWPRVRLNFKSVANARLSLRACESACSLGEDPQTPGRALECAALNHHPSPDGFAHHCDVFQPHQLQNVDGYVEADDRYSFYWKYCLNTSRKCGGEYAFTYHSDRYMDAREVTRVTKKASLEECLVECLDEKTTPCRSISFNRTDGGCHISSDSQLTKPQAIHLNNNPNFRIDYYENNCYNPHPIPAQNGRREYLLSVSDTFKFEEECRKDGILIKVKSKFPYTGALYGLYDFFTCRIEPKELNQFEYLFPSPTTSRNCSDSIRFQGDQMVLDVVLSTDGVEPLYFITPDDLTYQAKCPLVDSKVTTSSVNAIGGDNQSKTPNQSTSSPQPKPVARDEAPTPAIKATTNKAKVFKKTYPLPLTSTYKPSTQSNDSSFMQVVQNIIRDHLDKAPLSDEDLLGSTNGLLNENAEHILAQQDAQLFRSQFLAPIVEFFAKLSAADNMLEKNGSSTGTSADGNSISSFTADGNSISSSTSVPTTAAPVKNSVVVSSAPVLSSDISVIEPIVASTAATTTTIRDPPSTSSQMPTSESLVMNSNTSETIRSSEGTTTAVPLTTSEDVLLTKNVARPVKLAIPNPDSTIIPLEKSVEIEQLARTAALRGALTEGDDSRPTMMLPAPLKMERKSEADQSVAQQLSKTPLKSFIQEVQRKAIQTSTTPPPPVAALEVASPRAATVSSSNEKSTAPISSASSTEASKEPMRLPPKERSEENNDSDMPVIVEGTKKEKVTKITKSTESLASKGFSVPLIKTSSGFSFKPEGTRAALAHTSLRAPKIPSRREHKKVPAQKPKENSAARREVAPKVTALKSSSADDRPVASKGFRSPPRHFNRMSPAKTRDDSRTVQATVAFRRGHPTRSEARKQSILRRMPETISTPVESSAKRKRIGTPLGPSLSKSDAHPTKTAASVMTEVVSAKLQVQARSSAGHSSASRSQHSGNSVQPRIKTRREGLGRSEEGKTAVKLERKKTSSGQKASSRANFVLRRNSLMIPIRMAKPPLHMSKEGESRGKSQATPSRPSERRPISLQKESQGRNAAEGVKTRSSQSRAEFSVPPQKLARKTEFEHVVDKQVPRMSPDPTEELIPLYGLYDKRQSQRMINLLRLLAASMETASGDHFTQKRNANGLTTSVGTSDGERGEAASEVGARLAKLFALTGHDPGMGTQGASPSVRKSQTVKTSLPTSHMQDLSQRKQSSRSTKQYQAVLGDSGSTTGTLPLEKQEPRLLQRKEHRSPSEIPKNDHRMPLTKSAHRRQGRKGRAEKSAAKPRGSSHRAAIPRRRSSRTRLVPSAPQRSNSIRQAFRTPVSDTSSPTSLRSKRPRTSRITPTSPSTTTATTTTKPSTTTSTTTPTPTTKVATTVASSAATTTRKTTTASATSAATQRTTTSPPPTPPPMPKVALNRSPAIATAGPPAAPEKPTVGSSKPAKGAVSFDIFHNGQPVEAVVVGTKITLSFAPLYAIPPEYMSVRECQVEPIDSKYEWEREPLPIIREGCQADLVGLVCPPKQSEFGVKVTVESFRYQSTPHVQYSCLVRICPFAPCPTTSCPPVDGCPRDKRVARGLSLEEIRRALEADPKLASQIGIPPHMLANRPGHNVEHQLLALGGDHTVKRRLVVVNSEDQLRYYVRTGDIP